MFQKHVHKHLAFSGLEPDEQVGIPLGQRCDTKEEERRRPVFQRIGRNARGKPGAQQQHQVFHLAEDRFEKSLVRG